MARRRRQVTTSLFPFLSVLLCAIGVFVVVITGQNALSIGSGDLDQVFEIGRGASQGKQAVFGECLDDGLVLQPEGTLILIEDIKAAIEPFSSADNAWTRFLNSLEVDKDERYLVLLVRREGIETFEIAHYLAQNRGIDVGKDVVPGAGRLVFTEDGKPVVARRRDDQDDGDQDESGDGGDQDGEQD